MGVEVALRVDEQGLAYQGSAGAWSSAFVSIALTPANVNAADAAPLGAGADTRTIVVRSHDGRPLRPVTYRVRAVTSALVKSRYGQAPLQASANVKGQPERIEVTASEHQG